LDLLAEVSEVLPGLGGAQGGNETDGVDWVRLDRRRHVAAVLVVIASSLAARNSRKVI